MRLIQFNDRSLQLGLKVGFTNSRRNLVLLSRYDEMQKSVKKFILANGQNTWGWYDVSSKIWHGQLIFKNWEVWSSYTSFVRSFVRFLQAGAQPPLDPSTETLCWSNALAQGEKGNWCDVRCVCATCMVKKGLSRSEQLVGCFYSTPHLGVAYRLAKLGLALIQRQPEDFGTSICFGSRQRG